jgi:RimJ/RimL family protein N-acetyltransferase
MELRDGSLVLRPLDESDEEALVFGLNDPDVAQFMTLIPQPYTSEDAAGWVERCRQVWAEDASHPFAITDEDSGEFLGSIEVFPEDGSIGYWVVAGARGRGVATRALKLVCEAHSHLRLWLLTHPHNLASQRVAEKAGFRRVGIVPVEVSFRDGTAEAIRFERG